MLVFWTQLIPDYQKGAHKYDDKHIIYDADYLPYDGKGYTVFWDEVSGD